MWPSAWPPRGAAAAPRFTAAGLEALATWRHLGSFRFLLNSALMARSLGEVFADRLMTRMTLEDLPPARCGAIARA